jgi:hypothetical protein
MSSIEDVIRDAEHTMNSTQDVIRDLEHAALRLTAVPPKVLVLVAPNGTSVAALVTAVTPVAPTSSEALQKLADLVAGMLDSNVDHDLVFRERLRHHANPKPTE